MSLQTRLSALITAIGADIKAIQRARPTQKYITTRWYPLQGPTVNNFEAYVEGALYLAPVVIAQTVTFDTFAFEVVAAGSAGATVRMVIYNDTGNIEPNSKLYDSGAIAATTTGVKTHTSTLTFQPGVYWVGAVTQGGAATRPSLRRATGNNSDLVPSTDVAGGNVGSTAIATGVSGVPPATWIRSGNTSAPTGSAEAVRIWGRVAP